MDDMTRTTPSLEGQRLTSWSIRPGGDQVCLGFAGAGGGAHRIVLPVEALTGLLMTLPRILQSALDSRFPDGGLRVVYPLAAWTLEQAEGDQGLILKLGTPDGFEVAFAIRNEDTRALGSALLSAPGNMNSTSTRELH